MDAGLHILLVEDNPIEAALERNWLLRSPQSCDVTHVTTLAEAVNRLHATSFDAALLDLSLPDGSGIELLERIIGLDPHLPIVVLTGLDDEALATEAIRRGAQDYLVKDKFSGSSIIRAIHYARERKRAEETLHREKVLSESIINSLPGVFYTFDEQGHFLRWNKNFERVTGYSAEELAERSPLDLFVGPDKEQVNKRIQAVFTHGAADAEANLVSKDGKQTPYYFTGLRVVLNDQPCLLGVGTDITERKRAEEELRKYREHLEELVQQRTAELVLARDQAQAAEAKAEAANRAKSVFLASMSHELRTPLNAVLGFSQLMRADATLDEGQKENLDIINRSGAHLLGLINDVLALSRIEAGRIAIEETNFDLWNTLETIRAMIHSRAKSKGLRFLLERDASLPHYVRTDERRLQQVILNLAGNAVKFTRQGQVVLRASAEEEGAILRFEVEDTGPGIDPLAVPMLFEPFVQVGQNCEGAGLGLFISQKLVELLGGRITVSSEPGKGSRFAFDIPCQSVTATEIATKSVHRRVANLASAQPAPRVLVAEDTPESRLLMTKTLRSTGFDVIEAENGLQAVQLFEQCRPDIVLMDMRMPVMDGYEAIEAIRSTRHGKTTPIIAVTASAFEEERQKILAIGADNFISKPMQADELFEKIRLLLGIAYVYVEEQADGAKAIDRVGLEELVARLPKHLTDELADAMTVLDLDRFKTLLPEVARHSPPLAEELGSLAKGFQVTELVELFPATMSSA